MMKSEDELRYLPKKIIQCSSVVQSNKDVEAAIDDSRGLCLQIMNVLREGDSKWILLLIPCNSIVLYQLWSWSACSESLALRGYANALAFNVCALAVCLISIWVEQNTGRQSRRFAYSDEDRRRRHHRHGSPPTLCKSSSSALQQRGGACVAAPVLGLEKYEVFGLLASSCLCLFAQALLLVDAIARMAQQQQHLVLVHEMSSCTSSQGDFDSAHRLDDRSSSRLPTAKYASSGRLGLGAVVGVVAHLVTIVVCPDAGLNHVVCKALPCPTFNGINPILAANLVSFAILCGSHLTIHFWQLHIADIAAAFAVIASTAASMLPLAFYSVSIILRRMSHHMSEQLDRCLQEALIIDGVLEFRNERFWTKSFGKLSGSLEVRLRKNADENYVLGKVIKRLSQVVSTLSVKAFREPINLANNLMAGLPFEYYMDELLQNKVFKEAKEKPKNLQIEDIGTSDVVKIEDVLHRTVALTSESRQRDKLHGDHLGVSSCIRKLEKPCQKNFFPKLPVRNALLLGCRYDLEDLHCSTRLRSQ